jgi:tetratricopeptide (TPR) repeat protein
MFKIRKSLLIFLLIFLVTLTFTPESALAADNNDLNPGELFSEAVNYYFQRDYNSAAEAFAELLEINDLDDQLRTDALYYSALTAVKNYDTSTALSNLRELEERNYQSGRLYWEIGQLFLNKDGQFDSADLNRALEYLEKASELGLTQTAFKRDYAYAYRELGELDQAEKIYQEILNNNPGPQDYINIAGIMEKKGELNKAVEYYETALKSDINSGTVYFNLAKLYQKLGQYNSAVDVYKQGIKIQPDFTPFHIGLAESYLALENYSQAENSLQKAVELNPKGYYSYYLLGIVNKERGNYSQAFNYLGESLKNNPNYVKAYLAEGQIHLDNGDYYKAISRFTLAVEKNELYSKSRYYLGLAYYRAEMYEAARAELRKALHIDDTYTEARELLDIIEAR